MVAEKAAPVRVKPHFQRSVRLDVDFDRADALGGYIMQPSPRAALHTVARHTLNTQQRAFTWTGPFGGGKSSLALALALLAGGKPTTRKEARALLAVDQEDEIMRVFGSRKPWLVIPVVGRRESIEDAIGSAIDRHSPLPGRKPMRNGRRDVISELVRRSDTPNHGGILLILDELGKLLEASASSGEDIFFYQELAEAASRAPGTLVVIGVLHQAFEQYALKLGREAREEWAKVQGRFVDIPIVAGTDEIIELIGRAIECDVKHTKSARVAKAIASSIRKRRPSSPATLNDSLDRCWPLHPVAAALLGPSSRRRFGQNERSVFGFLSSAEPLGFREYLASRDPGQNSYYLPAKYWDYLRANLEPAILSSPDGHRWAVGAEAVERVEARFGEPHVSLVKTCGLIELFRNGSGVTAESEVLVECVEGFSREKVEDALLDLAKASILIYRKHQQSWGLYAGSDFDIEAAVTSARTTIGNVSDSQVKTLAGLSPISARRHYSVTGTLRWFDREILPATTAHASETLRPVGSSAGRFVLLLPSTDHPESKTIKLASSLSKAMAGALTLYGIPREPLRVTEQLTELVALEHVARTRPELEGDSVARREIAARLRQLRSDLEDALRDSFIHARWFFNGSEYDVKPEEGLSPLASTVCDCVFSESPRIHSELVNRDTLSSNAAKAQRFLLHRMLNFGDQIDLGYEGYPSDAGLYYTVVSELGIHIPIEDKAAFVPPSQNSIFTGSRFLVPLWDKTRTLLDTGMEVSLSEIYAVWRKPPFGVKEGLLPILALSYFLAHRSEIALYMQGMFVPDLSDVGIDEWLQDPTRVAWKAVRIDATAKQLLSLLSAELETVLNRPVTADPLDSARGLVAFTLSLPAWTQRTSRLSERTKLVRGLLLRASDPVKVIFSDLPELFGTHDATKLVQAISEVMTELNNAYGKALLNIHDKLLHAIDHNGSIESLWTRARVVQGISGDFKLDAFASRLTSYAAEPGDIEGLVALAVSKPPKEFNDHDLDHGLLQLAKWAFDFRRVETLASFQGRVSTRRALAIVFGGGQTISATIDVSEDDSEAVRKLADDFLDQMKFKEIGPDLLLAALADAGLRIMESRPRVEV
jgi:hypothetical protein